ncbi:MAG: CRISPR-associated endonuclease Cas2 [Ardenticatenaceae bacterium]|nr:CRISPR-associated endonuclease Cas2 [Anaerolineales bacterium]MCB9009413.1 CRISPR-associated endonuclease Cas2 [Ardenticatenaceae bacterium]
MHCLLIYDIPDDRIRTKVADKCLDYGLDRVQFSAFSGNISRNLQEELFLQVTDLLSDEAGNIQLLPICGKDWSNRLTHICEDEAERVKVPDDN